MKSITINIDGLDFHLKGNDDQLIQRAAEEVNSQIHQIRKKYKEELPQTTIHVLASLNLAETLESEREQFKADRQHLIDEINRMGEFLNEYLKNGQQL